MKYALLGSGKLARHFDFYLKKLGHNCILWNRRSGESLGPAISSATHVLLAVSDPAIPELAEFLRPGQIAVHFSGAAVIPGVFAAHPLMTFGAELQALEWYKKIPFVIDEGVSFSHILPGLPNPAFPLAPDKREIYHALCSLAGNSTFLLWQQIGDEFEDKLKLPRGLLEPFLQQVVRNALSPSAANNFTGPVAREDWMTVRKHLEALNSQPSLLKTYQNFIAQAAGAGVPVPKELL